MKSVLFFVHCFRNSPSSQRRVLDYEKFLVNAGIQPVFASYTPPGLYEKFISVEGGGTGLRRVLARMRYCFIGGLIVVLRWISLLRALFVACRVDAVFIQWITPPRWSVFLMKKINPRIVFDLDDAVFLGEPKARDYLTQSSGLVFAGSHFNLGHCAKLNPNYVFLPTPVPTDRFGEKEFTHIPERIVIGWIGSISTLPYIRPAVNALDRLAEKYPYVIFRIIGCGNRRDLIPAFKRMHLEVINRIAYGSVPCALKDFDIGIMPLLSIEWDKGKCVGKALEYMAVGVPCIISRYGENVYAVQDGENGF